MPAPIITIFNSRIAPRTQIINWKICLFRPRERTEIIGPRKTCLFEGSNHGRDYGARKYAYFGFWNDDWLRKWPDFEVGAEKLLATKIRLSQFRKNIVPKCAGFWARKYTDVPPLKYVLCISFWESESLSSLSLRRYTLWMSLASTLHPLFRSKFLG